jgi:hypothetical protein
VKAKTYRYLFWSIWFALVPLALAVLTQRLLAPADNFGSGGGLDTILYWIKDQPIPSIIIFFTLYEALLYNYRHHLPLAIARSPERSPGLAAGGARRVRSRSAAPRRGRARAPIAPRRGRA